jgi:hypothetical protein
MNHAFAIDDIIEASLSIPLDEKSILTLLFPLTFLHLLSVPPME